MPQSPPPGTLQRSKSDFILFQDFQKMNTQSLRQALKEQELAWLENLQPIAPNNLALVPGPGASIATIMENFNSYFYANISGVDYIIGFTTAGAGYAVNIATNIVSNFAPDSTFTAPDVTTWQGTRILIADPTAGYSTWDGTVFVQQGGISPNITILAGGTNYATAPSVVFTGGSGKGVAGTATIQNGSVVSIQLTNSGVGYAAGDAISVGFGGSATTSTWTPSSALNANNAGNENTSFRQECLAISTAGSQVNVTFTASTAGALTVLHASVAKVNVATPPNSDTVPVELLFGGQHGFSILAGQTITSDNVIFPVNASDNLLVIFDTAGSGGNIRIRTAGQTNSEYWTLGAAQSYNLQNVTGYGANANSTAVVSNVNVIGAGGGTGATAHCVMSGFSVSNIIVTNQGLGKGQAPLAGTFPLIFSGGGGTGAAGTATVVAVIGYGYYVQSATLTSAGSGYTSSPLVQLATSWPTPPTFFANLAPQTITSITVDTGGTGYATPPAISLIGGAQVTPTTGLISTVGGNAVLTITFSASGTYGGTPTVVIAGGGVPAVAVGHVWPFVPKPATLAVFGGRVWLGGGAISNLLQWTGTGTSYANVGYDDFLTADASGSLLISDSDLVHQISALRNYNNYLYIMGDQSVKQIGNISLNAAGNVTLFTILTLSSDQGTIYPRSCLSFNRVFLFANKNGVYAVLGATVQKVSDDLDGIFKLIDFTQQPCSALLDLNNIHNAAFLVRYKDPVAGTRSLIATFNGKSWYTLSQSSSLACITAVPTLANGQFALYGSSGTDVTPLFSSTTTPVAFKAQSSLSHHGNPIQLKRFIRAGFTAQSAIAATVNLSLDTEVGSTLQTWNVPSGFDLTGGSVDSNGNQTGGAGGYLGLTLTGTLAVGFVLTNLAIEFQDSALWK